ncbi:TolC family outer membrane protein [Alkalicaulis satelles]|uniref:TolC family outer membrane protein n=1 Tax=Alkalicaulis satelles TaxID=2609175 RepID=A0A5M6ZIE9_9PROT|nr:TolC family outer membrane protein [Alkalicaulis satelles]KAA5804612.1 TolC family outer membrane protein [Alkalicaulis satelles]
MKYWITAALAAGLMAGGAQVHAQSLEETLSAAYRSNPQLQAERARLRQSAEGVVQARSVQLPQLSASGTLSESETWGASPVGGNAGSSSVGASLSQPIYRGGRTRGSINAAQARFEAGRERLRAVEQGVLLDAVSAHANVTRDQQIVGIRSNNVEVLAEQLRAARDRFEVGEITRTDVAQAEARLSGARAQLSAAQAALAASRAAYARVTGIDPVEPDSVSPADAVPDALDGALGTALDNNPDLRAVEFNEIAARENIRVARGAMLPEVSLSASVNEGRDSAFSGQARGSAQVQARVSVPIFTGGLNQSRVREAQASADEARLSGLTARRQVVESVTNAWNTYLAAQAVIESSREAVRANEIAFEGVEQEAFVGLRTTLDVLNAEQELLNSRLELVRAERDLAVASYSLLQTLGMLSARDLQLAVAADEDIGADSRTRWPNFSLIPWN